jgi:hypothetical protein
VFLSVIVLLDFFQGEQAAAEQGWLTGKFDEFFYHVIV